MIRRVGRALLRHGGEVALSLGLVLTSFLAILAVGAFVLPEGTSLQALVREPGTETGAGTASGARDLRLSGADTRRNELAHLAGMNRSVKNKPATSIAWADARVGMALGERHSIQTFDEAWATIAFDDENELELGENSLVVLQAFDRREDGSDRRASLLLLGGEVHGRIRGRQSGALDVDLEIAGGRAKFRPESGGRGETEFHVEVDEATSSSRVSVLSGEAEVTAGGKSTRIESYQSLEVGADGPIGRAIDLPKPPRLLAPLGQRFSFRERPPAVNFAWDPASRADGYLLVIATDPEFREVVYRKELTATGFEHANLPAGRYFWRVSSLSDGLLGPPGPFSRFVLETDAEPPSLQVVWPDGTVAGERVEIRGRTEPDAHVFVADQRVAVDVHGRFSHSTALRRGANVIVVEAVDTVGNTAYESHIVNAEY